MDTSVTARMVKAKNLDEGTANREYVIGEGTRQMVYKLLNEGLKVD